MPRLLTCPHGHQWELPETDSGPVTGFQYFCPVCGTPQVPSTETGTYHPAGGDQSEAETLTPKLQGSPEEVLEVLPAPQELAPAPEIPGYEILGALGRGGMGMVYKARETRMDRLVALKVLPQEMSSDATFIERFRREVRAMAKLNHSNIVSIYSFNQVGSLTFYEMEYVDGPNLRQLLRSGPIAPRETLQIMSQICEALQYAHDEGIVHRDIKPENTLRDKRGRVKIADFGIAKLLARKAADYTLTGPWQVVGTFNYMAPEQIENPQKLDHRADIYSLGVMFYEMLTGGLPMGRFAPPSQKVATDRRIDEVVLKALEKEPERRYQHVSELKAAIDAFLASGASDGPGSENRLRAGSVSDRPVSTTAPGQMLSGQDVSTAPWPEDFPSWLAREKIRQRLRWLTVGLIISGLVDCFWLCLFIGPQQGSLGFIHIILGALGLLHGIALILGAQQIQELRYYRFGVLSCFLAMLPCSPGFLLGLPMGIWTLAVLRSHEVRAAFSGGQAEVRPVAPPPPVRSVGAPPAQPVAAPVPTSRPTPPRAPTTRPIPPPRRKGFLRRTFGTTTGWAMFLSLIGSANTFLPWADFEVPYYLERLCGYETALGIMTGLTFLFLLLLLIATGFMEPIPIWRPVSLFSGGVVAIIFPLLTRLGSHSLCAGVYLAIGLGFGLLFLGTLQIRGILMRGRESR